MHNDYLKIKLKYVAELFNGNSISDSEKDYYTGKTIPYISTKDIQLGSGTVNYESGLSVNDGDGFRIAPTNSVLMCIEGGSAGRKIARIDKDVAFVNKLCCFSAKSIHPNLLLYCLMSKDFAEQFALNLTGLIGGVTVSTLKNLYVTIPSDLLTQSAIAKTISNKVQEVNVLIANQQAQIEKLKQYKQSLITEVVTKGLDPNAPMKDSGVEWIGAVPASWKLSRIKNLFKLRNERNNETDLAKVNLISLYTDLGVVQHSELTETTGNRAVTAEGYKYVYKNDIVVNIILCWMGAIGRSDYDGVTSPAYDVYCPNNGVNSKYYHYLFRTKQFNGECYRYGRGIMMMRWRTYSAEFTSINIPVPPQNEQEAIVQFLERECGRIEEIINIKKKKIATLASYKQSLIYEYVTGKKEVL